ncbi:transcriptional regulator [Streptomyces radicis]|uniref:Transcriptional regulator n=2 Tax=Streptomyces radicis TaxID=1750517 RepID=A0A3A9WGT0_9ACTN|nr:transcriptional regulator [Streptomyces radicis]RKN25929.1 transcriptional regulator [Streptomyces radicis]
MNQRLEALIEEAGISHAGLAHRVNLRGRNVGLDLRYDKTSVSRWLRGQRPRGRTTTLIAEVLSEKLDRTVSLDEIGMAFGRSLASGVGLQFAADVPSAVENACELWLSDADPRGLLFSSTVSVSALIGPSRDWLIWAPDADVARVGGCEVGASDVEAVRATTQALGRLDCRFGAGHGRPIAVHYLNTFVSGLLRGSYSDGVGRTLFAEVAQLTMLAGYMALDVDRPSLAQRYYIQALRMTQMAGDRALGSLVLALGMSRLAPDLGHPREVLQLALVAREGAHGLGAATKSACHAAEARGYALLGDARSCGTAAQRAVAALGDAEQAVRGEGIMAFDRAFLAQELAHCYQDLNQPSESAHWAREALAAHPPHRVRQRVIVSLLLAGAEAERGNPRQASHAATGALELMTGLRSHLCVRYLRDFTRRLRTCGDAAATEEFNALLSDSGIPVQA